MNALVKRCYDSNKTKNRLRRLGNTPFQRRFTSTSWRSLFIALNATKRHLMSVTWLPKDRYTKAVFSAMESIGIEWRPLITGRNDRTVYFLAKHSQFGSIEAVKIGSTSHKRPNGARAKEVARQCVPSFCSMVAIIPNGDFDLEFELHKRFASSLIKGEWFNPDPDLMGLVSQLRLAIEKAE